MNESRKKAEMLLIVVDVVGMAAWFVSGWAFVCFVCQNNEMSFGSRTLTKRNTSLGFAGSRFRVLSTCFHRTQCQYGRRWYIICTAFQKHDHGDTRPVVAAAGLGVDVLPYVNIASSTTLRTIS